MVQFFLPVFSTDGKYLIFSSERDFNPIYSQTEWNHAYNRMGGVYMAMLANDLSLIHISENSLYLSVAFNVDVPEPNEGTSITACP